MTNKVACLFGVHTYEIINVRYHYDASWGDLAPSTSITRMCKYCKKIKTKDMYGVGFIPKEKFYDNQ